MDQALALDNYLLHSYCVRSYKFPSRCIHKTILYFRWSLIFGRPILSGAAALTGLYINQRFRRKLKLRHYGLLPTMTGLVAGPTIATSLLYSQVQSANKS